MNKNIIVRAYVNKNLGDDLFLKVLFERYPNTKFHLLDVEEQISNIFTNYSNVSFISMSDVQRDVNRFDGFVDIGGSIFIQEGRGLGGLKNRLHLSLKLKLNQKPTFVLGANFGPYKTKYFKKIYEYYFKYIVKDVCFRDKYSYNIFKNVKSVRYASDIVFQVAPKLIQWEKKKDSLGISVMDITRLEALKEYREVYINKMVSLISVSIKRGKEIYLISFCEKQGDLKMINVIISKLESQYKKQIKVLNYDGDIEVFLERYSQIESSINLRFHSLILSLVCNQKVYPIIYSNKTKNIIEDINLDLPYLEFNKLEHQDMELILNKIDEHQFDIMEQVLDSRNQFKYLDLFLG